MGFKAQNNTGKTLAHGEVWEGRQTLWLDMLEGGRADVIKRRSGDDHRGYPPADVRRLSWHQYVTKLVYSRMIWKHDADVFGKVDYYKSFFHDILSRRNTTPYGDCDDFALSYLELMLTMGVSPRHLCFLQVLSKEGQRKRYYGQSKARANHNIAGCFGADRRLYICDSYEGRPYHTTFDTVKCWDQTQYEPYLGRRLSWPQEEFRYFTPVPI
jgi:hypothetical protein